MANLRDRINGVKLDAGNKNSQYIKTNAGAVGQIVKYLRI